MSVVLLSIFRTKDQDKSTIHDRTCRFENKEDDFLLKGSVAEMLRKTNEEK